MKKYNVGDKLDNGATVILCKVVDGEMLVLAHFTEPHPWVTWLLVGHNPGCSWGHYYHTLREAIDDFEGRHKELLIKCGYHNTATDIYA